MHNFKKDKRKFATEEEKVPWNIPATYGAEYDEYDYFYTRLPADEQLVKTRMGYKCRCESCHKEFKTLYVSTHYFYTIDGWDSISYHECKKCAKLDAISRIKRASAAVRKHIHHTIKYAIISRRIRGIGGEYWDAFYANARRRTGPLDDFDKEMLLRVKKFVKKAKKNGEKPYMTKKEYAKIVRFANECQGGW